MKQLVLPIHLSSNTTFDNYIKGENAPLVHFLRNMLTDKRELQSLIWSKQSLGKTHLLQALCHQAVSSRQRLAYLPLRILRSSGSGILQGLDQLDLVCIDDIDVVTSDEDWCNSLFQLINCCRENATALVMSSRVHPGELDITLADLHSRLLWGPVFHIKKLSDEQLLSVIFDRADEKGITLPANVGRYLLKHCRRNVSDLFNIIDQLDDESLVQKRRVTLPLLRQVLADK